MTDRDRLAQVLRDTLTERDLEFEEESTGAFFVKLPGAHKLATMTWLVIGEHSLHVEAFFCRRPDENQERFWRWLLERNAKLYAVAFSVDVLGDVYLTGRLPLAAIEPEEIDRLLGAVLSAADDSFDAALEIGFRSSIEKEWDWRVKRGESLANLQAFAHFAEPANRARAASDQNVES
jgi:hypothetical protein